MKASTIQLIPQPKWTPFKKSSSFTSNGKPIDKGDLELGTDECYLNSRYQVFVYRREQVPQVKNFPQLIWLSIKRLDKEPIHDWRDMQRIKNELVGEEHDAVEVYPAESRLMDTANQYHLWVFEDTVDKVCFPFGWSKRAVSGKRAAEKVGGKQRPLDNKN